MFSPELFRFFVRQHLLRCRIFMNGITEMLHQCDLGVGAILHDVGKMWVPTEVLNKPGRLTDEEFAVMKKHTEYGHELLARQPELSFLVAHCAFQHHERINGTGYPRGLGGEEMHLFAKIISVADVYDALVMNRPYKSGMSPSDAMEFLFSNVGSHFEIDIVSQFSRKVSMYPLGTQVTLSDGREAVVVNLHDSVPNRPIVRILGDDPAKMEDVDLARTLNLTIVKSGDVTILESID